MDGRFAASVVAWAMRSRPYKRVSGDYLNGTGFGWGAASRSQACKWATPSALRFGQWSDGRRESKLTHAANKQISNNELKSPDMQYTDDGGVGGIEGFLSEHTFW